MGGGGGGGGRRRDGSAALVISTYLTLFSSSCMYAMYNKETHVWLESSKFSNPPIACDCCTHSWEGPVQQGRLPTLYWPAVAMSQCIGKHLYIIVHIHLHVLFSPPSSPPPLLSSTFMLLQATPNGTVPKLHLSNFVAAMPQWHLRPSNLNSTFVHSHESGITYTHFHRLTVTFHGKLTFVYFIVTSVLTMHS